VTAALVWGVVGLVAGLGLLRWLGLRSYRYADEQSLRVRPVWWVVPVLTVAGGAVGWQFAGSWPVALTYVASVAWMVALAAIDVDVRRLPDRWTLTSYPVVVAALAGCSLALDGDWGRWGTALVCGVASGLLHLVLAFVNPGGLGMGDVKLAVSLGLLTGWLGWPLAVVAFLAAFAVGTVVGIVVALVSGGGRKATFPFGPSMLAGALLVLLLPGAVP
jgi:leader peptidase (prepilin peptidase) / N-methyltransferase